MARRMIKFPLKMKNGAEVRSLEELQANADVESIMKYYFSGQLSLWCRAFGYEDIPAGITEINESFVKSVMDLIGVKASVEEMQEYIQNSFGMVDATKISADNENEEEIIDNETIKSKLKEYVDSSINLDDYEIDVIPVENQNGKIEKYRVSVVCEKTEQYYRFTLPYDVSEDYTKECYEDDLYNKIVHSITSTQENDEYNKLKNSRFVELKVGDTFEFGKFAGESIKWKILEESNGTMYVISKNILCEKVWDSGGSTDWQESDIRKWLNNDFYNNAFNNREKRFISDVSEDKITLLSFDEIKGLLNQEEKSLEAQWWLRSRRGKREAWIIDSRGCFSGYGTSWSAGVRPALYLKF